MLVAFKKSGTNLFNEPQSLSSMANRAFSSSNSESNDGGAEDDGSNANDKKQAKDESSGSSDDKTQLIAIGETETALKSQKSSPVPDRVLAIPLFRRPFFPAVMAPIHINDTEFAEVIQKWRQKSAYVGLFLSKETDDKAKINATQLHQIGVLGSITAITQVKGGTQILFSGFYRVQITSVIDQSASKMFVGIKKLEDEPYDKTDKEIKAYHNAIIEVIRDIVKLTGPLHREQLIQYLQYANTSEPAELADVAACFCTNADGAQMQEVIESLNIKERQRKALQLLKAEQDQLHTQQRLNKQIEESVNQSQKRYWLQEQLKQIKKELGHEKDEKGTLIDEYNARLKKLTVPEGPLKTITDELSKLGTLEPTSSEYNITRTYLDWLTQLPWGIYNQESFNIKAAQSK